MHHVTHNPPRAETHRYRDKYSQNSNRHQWNRVKYSILPGSMWSDEVRARYNNDSAQYCSLRFRDVTQQTALLSPY
ncbi:hypothetical protein RRG08_047794 [Elysia crispata]|uniref:Uncharacterized protein n=1 Tax=Elysia crispata TaxID=231223 RepID=A0AAE1CRK5_9GAST|nr:hypothetical protein RRG08_047794 [Elysia crispata]